MFDFDYQWMPRTSYHWIFDRHYGISMDVDPLKLSHIEKPQWLRMMTKVWG